MAKEKFVQILSDGVGPWHKGDVVAVSELGSDEDLKRLVDLGAVALIPADDVPAAIAESESSGPTFRSH